MARTCNNLSLPQKLCVMDALKGSLEILDPAPDGSKLCRYGQGVSDETIAAHFSDDQFKCTSSNVASVRVDIFGKLYVRGASGARLDLMAALETRVKAAEAANDVAMARIVALEAALQEAHIPFLKVAQAA